MALSSLTVISGSSINSSGRYAYTVTECDKTFACCRMEKKQLTSLFHRSDQKQQKLPKDRFQSFTLIDGETLKTIRQASSNINIFFLSGQLSV